MDVEVHDEAGRQIGADFDLEANSMAIFEAREGERVRATVTIPDCRRQQYPGVDEQSWRCIYYTKVYAY